MIIATIKSDQIVLDSFEDAESLLRIMNKVKFVSETYASKKGSDDRNFVLHESIKGNVSITITNTPILSASEFAKTYDS